MRQRTRFSSLVLLVVVATIPACDLVNKITGVIPVDTVSLNPDSLSLEVGDTAQLLAIAKDSDGNPLTEEEIKWTSTNDAVATVDSSGLVEAKGMGMAFVRAGVVARMTARWSP